MKKKSIILIALLLVICFAFWEYDNSLSAKKKLDYAIEKLRESAREEGYNESLIELAYGTGMLKISEEEYDEYIAAKEQYISNLTSEDFMRLHEITQRLANKVP